MELNLLFYLQPSSCKKRKQMEKHEYDEWKSTVVSSINQEKDKNGMVSYSNAMGKLNNLSP